MAKSGAGEFTPRPTSQSKTLHVGVTGAQHGRETGCFHLATAAFARLLIMAVAPHDSERAFTINFLFQAAKGSLHRLAFFELNFGQIISHPLSDSKSGWLKPAVSS
jgi:hypothetical protein